jgi:hypothetical protein
VSSAGKSAHRNSAELAVSGKDPEAHAAPQRTTTTGHEHSAHKQKSQGCCAWLFPAKQQDLTSARGKAGLYGGRSLVKSYKDTILLVGVTEVNGSIRGCLAMVFAWSSLTRTQSCWWVARPSVSTGKQAGLFTATSAEFLENCVLDQLGLGLKIGLACWVTVW